MSSIPPLMHFRSVFLSDVHLGYHGCQAELLLGFLRASRTRNLYLVGDIVDLESLQDKFCWPQLHTDVIRTLLGKAKHGTRVVYIPGNHDEAMRDYCGLRFGNVEIRRRCLHTTANGRRYLVTHGDQYDAEVTCPGWLNWIGSKTYRGIMYLHSHLNRRRLARGLRYYSLATMLKRRSGAAQRYIERYKDAVTRSAGKRRLDGVICGHIHRPDRETRHGIDYINDGDWVENCSVLVEHHDGRLELMNWPEHLEDLRISGAEPLHPAAA